jgi:hypothetical protein
MHKFLPHVTVNSRDSLSGTPHPPAGYAAQPVLAVVIADQGTAAVTLKIKIMNNYISFLKRLFYTKKH